jgi:hypothetical protein
VWKRFDDDRDEDEVNLEPVTYQGYDFVARMNVGLSMLVLFRKWSAVQGAVLLLLPTLVAMLSKVAEYLLPTGSEFGCGRLALVPLPLRSVDSRLTQVSHCHQAASRGLLWRQARSVDPATRSSFRSRHSR